MTEGTPDSEMIEEVTRALANGQKIEAIKIYKEATGKGLKEAKDFVEQLIPALMEKDPERFAKLGRSAAGCSSAAVLLVAVLTGVVMAVVR